MDLLDILAALGADDKQKFLDTMAYCETRVTADEGIPAVIALEDLTREKPVGWLQPCEADADMGAIMAAAALLYTNLFEARQKPDSKYPAICFAMSAVAESCFREIKDADANGKVTLVPYRDVVGEFIKP